MICKFGHLLLFQYKIKTRRWCWNIASWTKHILLNAKDENWIIVAAKRVVCDKFRSIESCCRRANRFEIDRILWYTVLPKSYEEKSVCEDKRPPLGSAAKKFRVRWCKHCSFQGEEGRKEVLPTWKTWILKPKNILLTITLFSTFLFIFLSDSVPFD